MKKTKVLSILIILCMMFSVALPMFTNRVYAVTKNEVTLNFEGGIIHDGYVEYRKIANVQLFKGDELVTNISNNIVIDLNEAEYKFVIEEIKDTSLSAINAPIKLNINNEYYPIITSIPEGSKSTFKLETSKFSGTLDVKFERTNVAINTKVENVYENTTSKGIIDLTDGKEYVIDFSKTDDLTNGLKTFADLDKTLYYKRDNEGLLTTENESEAVIKIVGNIEKNNAILTAVNVGTKKSDNFKGVHTKYTGSKLEYKGTEDGIINEIRTDYYTKCTYEFTFKYAKEQSGSEIEVDEKDKNTGASDNSSNSSDISEKKEEAKTEIVSKKENANAAENSSNPKTGDNVIVYFVLFTIAIAGIITLVIVNTKRKKKK